MELDKWSMTVAFTDGSEYPFGSYALLEDIPTDIAENARLALEGVEERASALAESGRAREVIVIEVSARLDGGKGSHFTNKITVPARKFVAAAEMLADKVVARAQSARGARKKEPPPTLSDDAREFLSTLSTVVEHGADGIQVAAAVKGMAGEAAAALSGAAAADGAAAAAGAGVATGGGFAALIRMGAQALKDPEIKEILESPEKIAELLSGEG